MVNQLHKQFLCIFVLGFVVICIIPLDKALAENQTKRKWITFGFKIIEKQDKILEVSSPNDKLSTFSFDLNIEGVYPNKSLPIVLIITYDEKEVEESKDRNGAVMPSGYWTCKSYILELGTGKLYKYEESCSEGVKNIWSPKGTYALLGFSASVIESNKLIDYLLMKSIPLYQIDVFDQDCAGVIDHDSWRWISDGVLTFSGGVCGTFLDYIFYVKSKNLEIYCSKFQKPGYGCRGNTFKPASEYNKKVKEIIKSNQ
jgi:hypothetical protein